MNHAATIVLSAGLLAGAGFMSFGPTGDHQAFAASPEIFAATGESFVVRSSEEASCTVTRGAAVAEGRSVLRVEPSCAALLPGMERVKFWQEQADGSVAFTENGVDPIVSFAVADGVAYESFQPSLPVISLDAVE